jgi:hypothetical protein
MTVVLVACRAVFVSNRDALKAHCVRVCRYKILPGINFVILRSDSRSGRFISDRVF